MPRVSVLLPVRDEEPTLAEALDSQLAQREADFEIVAVDDGSADASPTILDAFADRDRRVRVVRQEASGIVAALQNAVTHASGDILAAALRGTAARLIVLNTCDSEHAAQQLYSATSVPIVCNVGAVPDAAAYATARRFAAEIAAGRDIPAAFALAKTPTFRLIPDRLPMHNDEIAHLTQRIDHTEKRIKDHEDLFYGRPDSPGLIHVMAQTVDRQDEMRIILWILIVMFAAMLGTLAIMVNLIWAAAT